MERERERRKKARRRKWKSKIKGKEKESKEGKEISHFFPYPTMKLPDHPEMEMEILKLHDFPDFPGVVCAR